jgi:hypothetical protein
MKLSELTIEILKNFATLNQTIMFRKGSELTTITTGKTILANARVAESFPSDFGIYDLNKLLAKLSLYKDAEVEVETDRLILKSPDSRRKDYIKFSSPKIITAIPPDKKLTMDTPEHEFTLSADDLQWQRKSAGISGSPFLIFRGDGKKIHIQSNDPKDDSSDMSSTEIGKTTKSFVYVIKVENWKMLDGSYRVKLCKGLTKFEHTEKPVEYYVAAEKDLSTI